MTDVEGSTELWERAPEAMGQALRRHDELFAQIVPEFHGRVLKDRGEGDSMFCVFAGASDAVNGARALLLALEPLPFRVRMALHSGETLARDEDYYGPVVNRCARLRGACSGGRILLSQATKLLVEGHLPAFVVLKDHGNHRLKDLLRPERVFELLSAGVAYEHPPLRSLNLSPHNLPLQLTSFVGRLSEIGHVRELVGRHRWVTLLGVGGTGKTRLSLQVAAELAESFADGVWQAELATVGSAALLHRAVADALQCGEEPGVSLLDVIYGAVENRSMLLVLDNCEQIASEACDLIVGLLARSSGLSVLATSREALRGHGEHPYRVPPLGLPPLDGSVEEIAGSEAVQLFVERASAHEHGFAVSAGNAQAVAAICHRLAGIPLAIEQAASNISVLSPQQMLSRWEDKFPALATDERHAIERHETLRACFDWSYGMLTEAEAPLFVRLAIFSGGWSLEAAEAVCSGGPVAQGQILGLMQKLISKSLVVADQESSGEKRYRFLEPVRQYAAEKLDNDALADRHFEWFLGLAQHGNEELVGPGQANWLERLDSDHDNFRAALSWCKRERPEQCLKIAVALRRFWFSRGYLSEAKDWLGASLDLDPCADESLRATALNVIGAICSQQGLGEEAGGFYEMSLALWESLGDIAQAAAVNHNIGILLSQERRFEEASARLAASSSAYKSLDHRHGLALSILNLGICELNWGRYDAAIPRLREAIELFAADQDLQNVAHSRSNLALALLKMGDTVGAFEATRESFMILREIKDVYAITGALLDLTNILCERGEFMDAAIMLFASESMRHKSNGRFQGLEREQYELCKALVEGGLPSEDLRKCSQRAKSMSPGGAVEYALQVSDRSLDSISSQARLC